MKRYANKYEKLWETIRETTMKRYTNYETTNIKTTMTRKNKYEKYEKTTEQILKNMKNNVNNMRK